jgi:hypothetical protein
MASSNLGANRSGLSFYLLPGSPRTAPLLRLRPTGGHSSTAKQDRSWSIALALQYAGLSVQGQVAGRSSLNTSPDPGQNHGPSRNLARSCPSLARLARAGASGDGLPGPTVPQPTPSEAPCEAMTEAMTDGLSLRAAAAPAAPARSRAVLATGTEPAATPSPLLTS